VIYWPEKDPDEVLDYRIDWSGALSGDVISTSTWVVPSGIVRDSDTHDDTTATIWLSGGSANSRYIFTNRIVTDGGRTFDQSVTLEVRHK
jgi:hypothetical protein